MILEEDQAQAPTPQIEAVKNFISMSFNID
jgi:hypothetical protein